MTFIGKIKNNKNKQIQKQIADFKKLFKSGTVVQHIVNGKVVEKMTIEEFEEEKEEQQPTVENIKTEEQETTPAPVKKKEKKSKKNKKENNDKDEIR